MSCIEHSPCRQATWIGSLLLYFLVVTLVSYVTSEGLRFLTCKVGVMCTPGTVVRHHEVTALGTKSSSPEKDEISPIKCWGSRLAWLSECWWRRQWHPTPVLLPGKSHGWRSLVGCSPWGCEESDTTERLPFHFSLSCIGEGNGNPLQCSRLENPRDGGAWWAAVYEVAQSRTRLKRLSSSNSSSSECWIYSHICEVFMGSGHKPPQGETCS